METSNALTTEQCWALLRTARTCRVAYTERALPAIASLPFTADGTRIILNSPEGTAQHAAMRGAIIAFQTESSGDPLAPPWSITCIGQADPVRTSPEGPLVLAFEPELLEGRRLSVLPVTAATAAIPVQPAAG